MENTKKLIELKNSLSPAEQDELYRMFWAERVAEDVKSFCEDNEYALNAGQIENVAYRYVYVGAYDCNLDYWTNIEILVQEEERCNGI